MSVRRLAPPELQPPSFAFTAENLAWAKQQIAKYPEGRQASAVIPILWRAQEQAGGWTPRKAIECVADLLGMAHIRVLEVATFYTMFLLAPVGRKAHVQWCGTTPCLLRGGEDIKKVCERRIHHDQFHVSTDGEFSWEEVECLGACVNAPMVLIGRDTYEDLTPDTFEKVLDALARGETPKPGPQNGRQFSAPLGGDTTLLNVPVAAAPPTAPAAPPSGASDAERLAATEEAEINAKLATLPKDATAEDKANAVGTRPQGFGEARSGVADNLQRIKGIGRVNEGKLHALGIFHFDQIAHWTRPEIRWVGTYLAFPGRIDREHWVSQAAALAAGGEGTKKPVQA
jgi:NADH-quinone oxidoreductase subunit E